MAGCWPSTASYTKSKISTQMDAHRHTLETVLQSFLIKLSSAQSHAKLLSHTKNWEYTLEGWPPGGRMKRLPVGTNGSGLSQDSEPHRAHTALLEPPVSSQLLSSLHSAYLLSP